MKINITLICVLCLMNVSCKFIYTERQKKIIDLKDKFSEWRKSNICDKKRKIIFYNNEQEISGNKLLTYEFTPKEVIEIFGKPDSIFQHEKYYEYWYYTDVMCFNDSVISVTCYKDMIFNRENKLIESGGMCF